MVVEKADPEPFTELAAEIAENKSAEDLLRWTFETYGSRAAIVTSFQVDGMAILDMACKVNPHVRVITVDTCRMPQDTYDLIDEVRDRYGVDVEVFYPDQVELESMVTRHGANAFYGSVSLRLLCCEVRKVNPLNRALEGVDAWVSGLRRSQGITRSDVRKVEVDSSHGGIIKVNPLADWTESRVWDYVRNNNVPSNKLYEKGYTSIGCAPCTRPTSAGEDERSGRWWWEKGVPKECGIHLKMPRQSVS